MKNKNIHLIPIDKSKLFYNFYNVEGTLISTNYKHYNGVNIYITSDEEIKDGDWIFDLDVKKVVKADNLKVTTSKKSQCWYYKKIILTTDQDLIKDGIQAIDDEFLEWFVKNPSCEKVKIESWQTKGEWDLDYKIIIPSIGINSLNKQD